MMLMVGCSTSPSVSPAPVVTHLAPPPKDLDYLTEGSAADEYRTAVAAIEQPLPDGRDYPPGLPAGFTPTDGYLEAGAARNQANFTWLCAWEKEYMAADLAKDPARVTAAAAKLEWWATGPFYTQVMSDPDRGWVSNVLGPMRLGDSSGILADYRQMCSYFPTVDRATG